MPNPETPDDDALEQLQDVSDPAAAAANDLPELSIEAPEADAVDQQTGVDEPAARTLRGEATGDADEGDLAESAREVPYGDDDYR